MSCGYDETIFNIDGPSVESEILMLGSPVLLREKIFWVEVLRSSVSVLPGLAQVGINYVRWVHTIIVWLHLKSAQCFTVAQISH